MTILILGYYDRLNKNDNFYHFLFNKLFKNYTIKYENPYLITEIPFNVNYLVCGGGELINDYFLAHINRLKQKYETMFNKKLIIYGISIESVYKNNLSNFNYIKIFDYIITRSQEDYTIIKNILGSTYVKYLPDIVHTIRNYDKEFDKSFRLPLKKKIIAIFLLNDDKVLSLYDTYINNMCSVIKLLSCKYIFHLITYNSTSRYLIDDTMQLYNDIYNKLPSDIKNKVYIKNYTLSKLINGFRNNLYRYGICMRYHSHILCYLYYIPFVSLPLNENVINYMKEKNLEKFIEPLVYDKHYLFDYFKLIDKFNEMDKTYDKIYFNNIIKKKMIIILLVMDFHYLII